MGTGNTTGFQTVTFNGTDIQKLEYGAGNTVWAKTWVSFDEQGGSGVSDRYVYYGTGRTYGQYAPLPTPTRSGFTFGGWFTQTLGNGTQITNSTVVTTTNANQTLYAYWLSTAVPTTNPSFVNWFYLYFYWLIGIRNNDSLSADIRADDYTPPQTVRGTANPGQNVSSTSSQPSFATFTHYATATAANGSKTVSSVVSQTIT